MSDQPTIAEIDRDDAVGEALDGLQGATRGALLRRAGLIAGAGAAATLLPTGLTSVAGARSGGTKANDVKILNFALTLEYLEAAFYAEAIAKGKLTGTVLRFAEVVGSHEAAHVAALKGVLGSKAVSTPSFDFKGTTGSWKTFLATSQVLEDTGVAAYQGQAPLIHQNAVLASAGAILAVEARHASWVRDLRGTGKAPSPAPEAFSTAMTMSDVLTAVGKTGFITS